MRYYAHLQVVLICLIAFPWHVFAYYKDYSPFTDKDPSLFPLKCIEPSLGVRGDEDKEIVLGYEYIASGKTHNVVMKWDRHNTFSILRICDSAGVSILGDVVCDRSLNLSPKVYAGRINDDDVDDWVIDIFTDTCGDVKIDAVLRTIILSPPDGSSPIAGRVIQFWTYRHEFNDFVDLNEDGKPEMIFTEIIVGKDRGNGDVDRYWTHNLVQFKEFEMVSANHADRRFPSWVLCTEKPNHKPTTQLTKEQRVRLWQDQAPDEFNGLASEQ